VNTLYFTVRMGEKGNRSGKTQELVISFHQTIRNLTEMALQMHYTVGTLLLKLKA